MEGWQFKSIFLCNEINLNTISSHFGINKKFKWEDPLVLSDHALNGIIKDAENKWVYVYYFGSMVFINMEFHEIQDVVKYFKTIDDNLKNNNINEYIDDYKLEISPEYEYALYNDMMTVNEFKPYYLDIISLVLAKSISLKKIENDTDKLLDSIEDVIEYLESGTFKMSDKQLARTSAKVIRFKYNTISNLMLLDKPKSAWNDEGIESFFMEMIALFDINDRYTKINHKTDILKDITDVFGSLTHEKRATKLEIMVIVLIMFELLISIFDLISKYKFF
jgi:uncharacterized Rmd1/YagE family protein